MQFDYTGVSLRMRRSITKLIALALPVCFMLAFATCVTLCEEHASETSESSVDVIDCSNAVNSTEDDCCPLQTSDRALIVERSKLKNQGADAEFTEAIVSNSRLMVSRVQYSPRRTYSHFSPNSPPHLRI